MIAIGGGLTGDLVTGGAFIEGNTVRGYLADATSSFFILVAKWFAKKEVGYDPAPYCVTCINRITAAVKMFRGARHDGLPAVFQNE